MLKPLRQKSARGQVSRTKTLPAPTKGWYVGANLADAPAQTAFILDNAFPQLDYIRLRRGSASWSTGMGAYPVRSLMTWTNGATHKMFAACNNSIYEVSSAGAVGAAAVTGLSGDYFEPIQFTGPGGTFLVAANGYDGLQVFNGSTWNTKYTFTATTTSGSDVLTSVSSTAGLVVGQTVTGAGIPAGATVITISGTVTISANASASASGVTVTASQVPPITGLSGNPLAHIWTFKNRIYGVARDSLDAYYLGLDAIGGTATKFPLSSVFKLGGSLLCGGTWAIDSTSGIYEACAFITTEGEVAVYRGAWPGDPAWELIGVHKVSRPLGRRCLMKAGGDLAIMTEDGIVPMSKVQTLDQEALQNVAVTKAIAPAWRQAVIDRTGLDGWQIVVWPLESMGVVNLPKSSASDATLFIANVRTGAWARYTGWDANCFAVHNNQLFYGTSDGQVMQAETGGSDNGMIYTGTIFPSYSNLGAQVSRKVVKMIYPRIQANFTSTTQITIRTDYDATVPLAPTSSISNGAGAKWDMAKWGTDTWPASISNQSGWTSASGVGAVVSPVVQVSVSSSSSPDFRLTSIDILFENGNAIG